MLPSPSRCTAAGASGSRSNATSPPRRPAVPAGSRPIALR